MSLVEFVRAAWFIVAVHALLGLAFAGAMLFFGVGRIDPSARGAGLGFRLLILPGMVVLWPVLAWKWWGFLRRGERPRVPEPEEWVRPEKLRRWHSVVWIVLAVAGPLGVAVALAWRPMETPAGRASPPMTPSVHPLSRASRR